MTFSRSVPALLPIQLNNSSQPLAPILVDPTKQRTMDDMDDETRRRLEEEIVELQAQHEEALKTTFSSQKERRRELNRIKTAIRHRRKKITHPGLATKQRRIRRQQKREQRAMEENIRNRAHRDLDPLDLERSMASSVSHIAVVAAAAQAALRNRTCHF
jgi:hypothetical protein